ncbi:MAG: hypothetical protein INH41_22135 [Myxococcaceae bacterium]|jgi:hypothetical protein|nr:hypothetical protein [Myxococcaceae bacterium]MCA3015095.1 hypothetical protein [Myxococcaceae bacterium]
MIAALTCLLLVSVLAAGLFLQTREAGALNRVVSAQAVAAANAEMGLQEAVRRVRSAQFDVATLAGTCTPAQVDLLTVNPPNEAPPAGACNSFINVGPIVGVGNDPMQGGGLLYRFIVYKPNPAGDLELAAKNDRITVRVIGYFGQAVDALGVITTILETEVETGITLTPPCPAGDYGCQ